MHYVWVDPKSHIPPVTDMLFIQTKRQLVRPCKQLADPRRVVKYTDVMWIAKPNHHSISSRNLQQKFSDTLKQQHLRRL